MYYRCVIYSQLHNGRHVSIMVGYTSRRGPVTTITSVLPQRETFVRLLAELHSRVVLVSGDKVRVAERFWLLPHPDLHAQFPNRHHLLGLLLAQRRGQPSPSVSRLAHRAHPDHTDRRGQPVPAQGILHQGH